MPSRQCGRGGGRARSEAELGGREQSQGLSGVICLAQKAIVAGNKDSDLENLLCAVFVRLECYLLYLVHMI